jgi:hypothetical protein
LLRFCAADLCAQRHPRFQLPKALARKENATSVPKLKRKLSPRRPKAASTTIEQGNFAIQDSIRELSEQPRRQAVGQFSALARWVAEHPALLNVDKIDALLAAFSEISNRLVDLSQAIGESVPGREESDATLIGQASGLRDVSKQLIDRISAIEGIAVEDLQQAVGALACGVRARRHLSGEAFARPANALRPPVRELTSEEIEGVIAREKEKPWNERPQRYTSPFEWVRDNYGQFIPGLRTSHLKIASPQLYNAFCRRVSREGRPEWLDVPSDKEHHLRKIAFSDPVQRLMNKRKKDRERVSKTRD